VVPKTEVPLGSLSDPPNAITASRLVVTVFCFACLSLGWYRAGFVAFVLAAATDWADGYWARRWGPITKLGRVLDPLADKLLICGAFTYLAAIPESRVAPWMAVVVLAREFLVTTLRAFVESSGGDFSAVWIGKWKFVAQVVAASLCLLFVSPWRNAAWPIPIALVDALLWAMLALTVLSGITYTRSASRAMRGPLPPGG
jgi:CDP-diacylglycerol---glycerol-3-phosphate 3-phosphatidyltransferase